MSQIEVETLAVEVYGEGVTVQGGELGPGIVQLVVMHPAGMPLALVTARSEEQARAAVAAALSVVKSK